MSDLITSSDKSTKSTANCYTLFCSVVTARQPRDYQSIYKSIVHNNCTPSVKCNMKNNFSNIALHILFAIAAGYIITNESSLSVSS